jgi:ATP-dependent Lon protease
VQTAWRPPADVYETPTRVSVTIELAETQQRMSKTQRDFFLREQLHSIQHELGEGDENPELAQLRQRLEEAQLPEEALREAQRELDRLAAIPPASPEYGLIRTYLDWMVSLPWNAITGGDIGVRRARSP